MKILLATYEYPPDRGGVATYLSGLAGALSNATVRVARFRLPRLPFGWLPQLPQLWLAARAADVVLVSHVLPMGTLARLLGKPYAVIVHGLDLRSAARHSRKKRLAARVLKDAKLIVANSRATASELAAFGLDPASALVLTPCPSGACPSGEDMRKALGLEGKRIILSVARFVPRKGLDRLIRMLPALRASCGEVALVLAGGGPEEGSLRSEASRIGAEPHVRFVMSPDAAKLSSLYRAADVFALPVRASKDDVEGFGIVYLEAARFGVPVVGTRTGGVPEAVEDGVTGLLADPDSDEDVRRQIERLLRDPELARRLGEAGRARIERDFKWPDRAGALLRRLA